MGINQFCAAVKNVAEHAIVDGILSLRLLQACEDVVVKLQRATQIAVDGGGRELLQLVQSLHHLFVFLNHFRPMCLHALPAQHGVSLDGVPTFYHHLQHEPAHFARMTNLG